MKNNLMSAVLATAFVMVGAQSVEAGKFSISFEWGNIPHCTNGFPVAVQNPIFTLSNVPTGTKKIKFQLQDLVQFYFHADETVTYTGQKVINPGVFKYQSPCPPGKVHTYEWTAWAKDASGALIGAASAQKDYPDWLIPEAGN